MYNNKKKKGVTLSLPLPSLPHQSQTTTTMADTRADGHNDADLPVAVAAPDPKNVQELTKYVN